ncbi:hypothetical protein RhiirA1_472759 [Rhizophagus irregularis]|uniref:BTB domain-containing protein n=1 Tax=Rhizophagus irregularis TaxID=588596 RepID=A0A2N0R1S8_9GLOM|nr:hypothetical protein RhiirA1_472759 [Rhizophagus irregularis]
MTRGYSLEKDLNLLINNPKYSDIEILCEDEKKLYDLQDFIMKTFKNTLEKNCDENYSPELLSKLAEKIPLTEDNILLNLLVEAVAIIPLNTIEFGRLSITGLKYLLSCTHEKEETPFATPEYEVFRYGAILAAKQVLNEAYITLMEQLLILEQIRQENPVQIENKIFVSHQKVAKELEPLVKLIDFRRIKDLNDNRGMSNYVYDDVSAKVVLGNKGVFEWDVIIEKSCTSAAVGVCASENFNYETWAGYQTTGWVLGSIGYCCNFGNYIENYCPLFGDGTKITVHLDMNKELALLQSMEQNIQNDIEILCNEKKLYGCRMILATKSEMFGKLLYYRMKEDSEPKISFPTINSSVMGTILEYFYTGSIKDETLTKYNIIEPFDAADCFQLLDLQKSVFINNLEKNYTNNYLQNYCNF